KNDQIAFGVIGGDRLCDILQQYGLTSTRRRNDQRALALAERSTKIDDPGRAILGGGIGQLHIESLVGIERGEVIENDLVADPFGILEIDGVDLQKRE